MRWSFRLLPVSLAFALVASSILAACTDAAERKPKQASDESEQAVPVQAAPAQAPKRIDEQAGQSFFDGMQALCDSIDAAEQVEDPAEQQRLVAAWIDIHVSNAEVRELFTIIGDMPAKQRPGMMRAAAIKAGVQDCPLAER